MRLLGLLLIAAAFIIPSIWFIELASRHDPTAVLSQFFGVSALIAMGIAQLLATRLAVLEVIFGGLDRIYVLHKWLGVGALALILLHDTIDAEMDDLGAGSTLSEIAETLGEISLYGLLVLATLSILTFVPYHLWKYTHKLMGGFFAAAAFHYSFIQKPFALSDPVGIYVLAFCGLGVLAYLYTLIPDGTFRGARAYTISGLQRTGEALAVTLAPSGRGFKHEAGQFAFVQFSQPGLTEIHPFTISQAPNDERSLRFTIRSLGDFTSQLESTLATGSNVRVVGPFGHFRLRPDRKHTHVWIASGVGITPFAAWAEALPVETGPVHLFYSARTDATAPHLDDLQALAAKRPNLHLHFIASQQDGRLTAKRIIDEVGGDMSKVSVSFCGPVEMRRTLQQQFKEAGLPGRRFHFEEFEIRSGLGLRRLLASIQARQQGRNA